ncbi:hypothetical protein BaRGS_00009817 [Batillaria attramentaria]|uniref:Uncharacterized protein n=1 Tax=Batillaria attramentaria TaxID=370345 RepID=A0ABD0LIS7_9CAEN
MFRQTGCLPPKHHADCQLSLPRPRSRANPAQHPDISPLDDITASADLPHPTVPELRLMPQINYPSRAYKVVCSGQGITFLKCLFWYLILSSFGLD